MDEHGPDHNAGATEEVVLLLVDLVDSTALVQALGDQRASVVLGRFAASVRTATQAGGGREIDHTDGFLLLFDTVPAALAMALQLHREVRRLGADNHARLAARIGLHRGQAVLARNSDEAIARGAKPVEIEGLAKAVCARICALAGAGQTLLSGAAFEAAQQAPPLPDAARLRWLEHGLYLLKGIDDPEPVYEVGYEGEAPLAAPADADKARLLRDDDLVAGWRAGVGQEVPGRPGWKLERKLGAGGYGDAWLAREEVTDALRAFKFCYTLSRLRSLQREVALFRLMQRALGERDDIARILDWHLDEAPYFIESEYSTEGDLESWCNAQGGAGTMPLDARLELIAQVADALAAAHAVGVLHKDIKPGNVLIHRGADGEPRARLADFGIGAVSAASRYRYGRGMIATGMTEMLVGSESTRSTGTRMYLAPEQIEGRDATTHADVYALGILLYQAVAGDFSKSLAPGWEQDVADPLLREDIAETIARDPAQRTGNLSGFAARLRDLDARRRTRLAAEREAAQAARRRRLRRWLVPVVAGLVVLVAVLGFMLHRISDEATRANREAAAARAVTDYLVGLFQQADPLHARGQDLTVREVMDKGFDNARKQLASQPEVQARLLSALGRVYQSLGLYSRAESILEDAWRVLENTPDTDAATRAEVRLALVDARNDMGRYPAALALGKEALEDAVKTHGADSIETANVHSALGSVLNSEGDYPAAETELKAAIGIYSEHRPEQDTAWADAEKMLAENYLKQQRRAESIPLLESALSVSSDDLEREQLLEALGGALREEGHLHGALQRFEQCGEIFRRYKLTSHGQYASVLFNIAAVQSLMGDFESARKNFAGSLAIYRKIYGERPYWAYALTLKALGGTLENLGRYSEAEPLLRESMTQYVTMHGNDDTDVARMLGMVALAEVGRGNVDAGLRDGYTANARLKALATASPDDPGPLQSYAEGVLTVANAQHIAGRDALAAANCAALLAFAGKRLDYPSIYNDARRAKLLLCAGRDADAAPLLAKLDKIRYRDPWLDTLRKLHEKP
jgi:serine/threonine-protein kinase